MANLKNKSEMNIDAAEELILKNLYASSIHCSYYGCFQLMIHKLVQYLEINYNELEGRIRDSNSGTHVYVFDKIEPIIEQKSDLNVKQQFKRQYKQLKLFRVESDYKDQSVDIEGSTTALAYSKELIGIIKKYL